MAQLTWANEGVGEQEQAIAYSYAGIRLNSFQELKERVRISNGGVGLTAFADGASERS